MKYSVIIPVHDEVLNISPLYISLKDTLLRLQESYEIIFVDDGSRDGSFDALNQLPADHDIIIISLSRWYGQSIALQAGFDHAAGEILITVDGDRQFDPEDIPRLLEKMEEGYDMVYGWRYQRKDSVSKKIQSKIANLLQRLATSVRIHDVGCSLRVFKRMATEKIHLSEGKHRFFAALALKYGMRITEVKVSHFPRQAGVSKYGLRNRLWEGIRDLWDVICLDPKRPSAYQPAYQLKAVIKK